MWRFFKKLIASSEETREMNLETKKLIAFLNSNFDLKASSLKPYMSLGDIDQFRGVPIYLRNDNLSLEDFKAEIERVKDIVNKILPNKEISISQMKCYDNGGCSETYGASFAVEITELPLLNQGLEKYGVPPVSLHK